MLRVSSNCYKVITEKRVYRKAQSITKIIRNLALQLENESVLQQVLSYHVLPGEVPSSEISSGEVESLDGGLVTEVSDEEVIVSNVTVNTPDIQASNGIIRGIDRVLLPADLQSMLADESVIEESELF